MKEYTREQMRALLIQKGMSADETTINILMALQEAHQSAYKRGYQDGLKSREVPSEL